MGTSEVGLDAFCIVIWLQDYGGQGVECDGLNENGPYVHHQEVELFEGNQEDWEE